jgi:prepilin-type N-terminal cleavage/methylation domain-containing protein
MDPRQPEGRGIESRPVGGRARQGFTLVELLVVIGVIAVLLAILFPVLHKAREAGRRAKCMGSLRQLQIAWQTYAEDYGGSIVCGMPTRWAEASPNPDSQPWLKVGRPWLFDCEINEVFEAPTRAAMDALMRTGALGSYAGNMGIYRCPARPKVPYPLPWGYTWQPAHQWLSAYGIVCPMNCFSRSMQADIVNGFNQYRSPSRIPVCITRLSQLSPPGPSRRMVFVDGGHLFLGQLLEPADWLIMRSTTEPMSGWTEGGFGAPIHHSKGTCTSFADGHVRYWRWKDPRTVAWSQAWRDWLDSGGTGSCPTSPPFPGDRGNDDFLEFYEAIWGRR